MNQQELEAIKERVKVRQGQSIIYTCTAISWYDVATLINTLRSADTDIEVLIEALETMSKRAGMLNIELEQARKELEFERRTKTFWEDTAQRVMKSVALHVRWAQNWKKAAKRWRKAAYANADDTRVWVKVFSEKDEQLARIKVLVRQALDRTDRFLDADSPIPFEALDDITYDLRIALEDNK